MNEFRSSATIAIVSHPSPNAGWSWSCSCGVSDQMRRITKGAAVDSARRHGNKKHSRYGFVLEPEYQ